MTDPVIETARLILRVPEASDLDGWCAMTADEETMRFIGGTAGRSSTWRQLCTIRGAWAIRGFSMFSVIEKASDAWIGRVGPWEPEGWPAQEVGWAVTPQAAGHGYAHEAAVAALDYVFDTLGWDDVIHVINPANTRSIALARRLGSSHRGQTLLPEPFHEAPVDAWGQSAAEWRARRAGLAGR